MKLKRIIRLLKLLQTLQSGQGDNADGLAKACGVSRRTVFRDLETLRAAGVPIHTAGRDGHYAIAGDFFLRPANFTTAEALSLIALAGGRDVDYGVPFFGPARSAAIKLESSLPWALRKELQAVSKAVCVQMQPMASLTGKESVYQTIVDSITERRVARIEYHSLTEWETIQTNLRPYRLLFNRHSWYVIGRSSAHGEPRTFNLTRIKRIELTNKKYVLPRKFSIERYLGNAWNLMPQPGSDYHVVVRFSPLVAKNVAEVAWHRTQRVEFQTDGSIDFHADVSGLSEIAWWILSYGDQAEVLAPSKLRKTIAQRIQNMHQLYADARSRSTTGTTPASRVQLRT